MSISSLGSQYISASWTALLQYSSSGQIYDGAGNLISTLAVTASGAGGGSGVYAGTSPTTTTVGGLTGSSAIAGLTYDQIFQLMLCPYNAPSFASFGISGQSTSIEVGTIISGSKSFTWSFNQSGNVQANTLDIVDTTNSTTIVTNTSTTFPYTATLGIVSKSVAGTNVWTATADNTQSTQFSSTFTVNWRWKNYLAASSTVISDNSTAQIVIDSGVVDSILDSDRVWTATCTSANNNASNYTYIIYPATYGDLSTISHNGPLPVLSAFTKLGDYTISNVYGKSTSFRIYKSNSPGAFANDTTLAIT